MHKLGKGFLPTAVHQAKARLAGQDPGAIAGKVGKRLGGASGRSASLGPSGMTTSRSFTSTTSSTSLGGESLHKGVRTRQASCLPAPPRAPADPARSRTTTSSPAIRDAKASLALERPHLDVESTEIRRDTAAAGTPADLEDLTPDQLHAQMYEHDPVPSAREQEDTRFQSVVEQAAALDGEVDARTALLDPALFKLTQAELALIEASKEQAKDGVVKRPTLALDSDDWRLAVRQYMPEGAQLQHVFTAEEVNAVARSQGKDPPWKEGTKVLAARFPAGTRLWQVVSNQPNAQGNSQVDGIRAGKPYFGDWFLRSQPGDANEARFLAAIRPVYKETLSHAAYLNLERETLVMIGIAGAMPDGLAGGAVQVLCLDKDAISAIHVVALAPETGKKQGRAKKGQ